MTNNEVLASVLNLAIGVNTKDVQRVSDVIQSLSGVALTNEQRSSLDAYEENLIYRAIDDSSLLEFFKSPVFQNQSVLDVNYVTTLSVIGATDINIEEVKKYLLSDLSFSTPLKQYRYCYLAARNCLTSGNTQLMELALEKMNNFNIASPDFIPPEDVIN